MFVVVLLWLVNTRLLINQYLTVAILNSGLTQILFESLRLLEIPALPRLLNNHLTVALGVSVCFECSSGQ